MKPEEKVRADFEAWHTLEFGSCDWHNTNHANRWIGYQAAYAQARRETLEEAAECLRLHAIGHFTLLEAERALEKLIKD